VLTLRGRWLGRSGDDMLHLIINLFQSVNVTGPNGSRASCGSHQSLSDTKCKLNSFGQS
jgi:hypothetical protein